VTKSTIYSKYFSFFSKKVLVIIFTNLIVLTGCILFYSNYQINHFSKGRIYSDLNAIPKNKVGLVLGTSRHMKNGQANPFFYNRIKAAASLFFAGKIRYVLVSGDNRFYTYNEPREMKRELMKMGIPDSSIIMDFAGFRTLDSVVRCKKVFGQSDVTIISQEFHNERALFIAKFYEMNAVAYSAKDPDPEYSLAINIREYFARTKVFLDLYILHKSPYFLGKSVKIGNN
jgi:SanA protein